MSQNTGTLVPATINTLDSADLYPTHVAERGKGGWMCVANSTARTAIPAARRTAHMVVVDQDTGFAWRLLDNLTDWERLIKPPVRVDVFLEDGVWEKPENLLYADVIVVPGGPGGGSGSSDSSGGSGAGAGGGSVRKGRFLADQLSSTVAVAVGEGGLGGDSVTGQLLGNDGEEGEASSFGALLTAYPGSPGSGGRNTNNESGAGGGLWGAASGMEGGAGGGGDGSSSFADNANDVLTEGAGAGGAAGNTEGAGFKAARSASGIPGAGSGGGANVATTTAYAGGAGRDENGEEVAGGAIGQDGTTKGGVSPTLRGAGGGGGGGANAGPAGNGGDGQFPGGPGGGGGKARSGPSGRGGKGANGIVVVISHMQTQEG